MFPCLVGALGEDLFSEFALDYLGRHPSQSYTLETIADAFPQHLERTRPDADAAPDRRERWPDFIIDLASLELAFLKVYDGPGLEADPPDARALRAIDAGALLATRLAPAPCLRLFAFRYPVHEYWRAARRGDQPDLPPPRACFVAMTRRDYRVVLHEVAEAQHALLRALDGRRSVGQALDQGARERPPLAIVHDWLCEWTDMGILERAAPFPPPPA